mgnify:FL=1
MKLASKVSVLLVLLCGLFLFGSSNSQATDVWVSQYNGIDIYVMDNTIRYSTNGKIRSFTVSTKRVRNGQLLSTTVTEYSQYKNDMWRYYIQTQYAGRFAVLSPRSPVFEYVMDQLGWAYYIQGRYYY